MNPVIESLLEHHRAEAKIYAGRSLECDHPTTAAWHRQMADQHEAWTAAVEALYNAAEALWGVVANASGGDWSKQSPEWIEAAGKARDAYYLKHLLREPSKEGEKTPERVASQEIRDGSRAPFEPYNPEHL